MRMPRTLRYANLRITRIIIIIIRIIRKDIRIIRMSFADSHRVPRLTK